MYQRANEKWEEHGPEIFGGACGFSILSGPPIDRPDLLIVGENPGFGAKDRDAHVEACWPETSYLESADWPLALKLRWILDQAGMAGTLDRAVQTNFNFFKSSSSSRRGRFPWLDLDPLLRNSLERFSKAELNGFIARSKPNCVLVLGIGAFRRHAGAFEERLRDRKGRRVIIASGTIGGARSVALIHPTGAHVAGEDWTKVARWLRERFGR
jgi:hypothetical protein